MLYPLYFGLIQINANLAIKPRRYKTGDSTYVDSNWWDEEEGEAANGFADFSSGSEDFKS